MKSIKQFNWLLYGLFILNTPSDLISENYTNVDKVLLEPAPYEVGAEAFKTLSEIKDYFKANRVKGDFVDEHQTNLISASHIFEIPYAFQTCLLYSESRFKVNAISPVGARGVAQFTKETYNFIKKVLKIGKRNLEDLSDNRIAFGFEDRPSRYVLFNKILFSELYLKWQAYLRNNEIADIKFSSAHFEKVVNSPEYAIGISSLYLKYLKERMRYRLVDQYNYEEGPLNPNVYLTLAGAYNQGIGRTWRLSARNKDVELKYIVDYQSRVRETKNYIKSISSCMSPKKTDKAIN